MRCGSTGVGAGQWTLPGAPPGGRIGPAAALLAGLLLAACARPEFATGPNPMARPDGLPPVQDAAAAPDALTAFYAGVEGDLTASGRMRRETAPVDAPFSVDDLVRNFERIALYDEYVDVGGRFVRQETPSYLRRWDRPVRVGVMTGPSIPAAEASRDRANVAAFTRRLGGLTGLDMRISDGNDVNFLVLFMSDAERIAFAEQVRVRYPEFAPAVMSTLVETPLDTFCTAYAFADPGNRAVYSAALIVIRAEHPPLTRLSCVHEEMAQAMGLPNDSPDARPSLFNDSLEFALLTEHDEILLRMLYDPRLRPGMTVAEAGPLLPQVAADAMAAQAGGTRVAAVQ
jgi:hypothetical protein